MSSESLSAALEALGVDETRLGPAFALPDTTSDEVETGSVRKLVTFAWLLANLPSVPFHRVLDPTIEAMGMRIEVAGPESRFLKVGMPFDAPSEVAGPGVIEGVTFERDELDPATLLLDTGSSGPVVIVTRDGSGIVIDPAGRTVRPIAPLPPPIAVFPVVESPSSEWARSTSDRELGMLLEEVIRFPDSWTHVVAAGLYARLFEAAVPSGGPAIGPDHELVKPRLWARRLSRAEKEAIESFALAEVDRCEFLIDELCDRSNPADANGAELEDGLTQLCRRRDDLECVRVVLASGGREARLVAALARLDERADELAADLDSITIENARLRRVARVDPDAWWAVPADEFPG